MSRKDDLALTGQGIGETTRTDALREKLYSKPWSDSFMDMMLHARQLERELNQAISERDRLQSSLRTLIALHEREIETGQPISGEDWEIAGYALTDK